MKSSVNITKLLKAKALKYGFDEVGISKAEALDEDAKFLKDWLNQGMQGEMSYMENHFDLRTDPRKLVEGAKSVVSLTYNYNPKEKQKENTYKIAKYAYGKDYHKVIRKKLQKLVDELKEEIGEFNARVFTDSAPILEHAWAKKSGLGWIGKNSLLLTKGKGSFFFLAEIICDLEMEYGSPVKDYCGSCTKCIDACPTNAIFEPYKVDGSKCISYATIEKKGTIPSSFKGKMQNWIYGCDICQDVCPINARAKATNEEKFVPKKEILNNTKQDWENLSLEEFNALFEGSAVKRTKHEGLKRNIDFLKN